MSEELDQNADPVKLNSGQYHAWTKPPEIQNCDGFRFWSWKEYIFAYTLRPTSPAAGERFRVFRFKWLKKDRTWSNQKCRLFKRKWKARDQALKWLCQKSGQEFKSLHVPSPARQEQGRKLFAFLKQKRKKNSKLTALMKIHGAGGGVYA